MPAALVTGGTGFAGRFLAERLLEDGYDVHVTAYAAHRDAPQSTVMHSLDVRDGEAVAALIREVAPSEVYHLAGLTRPGAGDVAGFWNTNFGGARSVLEAAASTASAPSVLLVGSAYAYAPSQEPIGEDWPLAPSNHYGSSKAAAEMLARAWAADGLRVVMARPFNHSGPGQHPDFVLPTIVEQVAGALKRGAECVELDLGNLDAVRDISDVRDVVAGYALALREGVPGEAYNLGSGVGHTIRELVELVASVAEVGVTIRRDESRLRSREVSVLVADTGKIRQLGWSVRRPLRETVADMLAALAAKR